MKENLSKKIFLLGLVIFVISYLLPVDIFESYTSLRPTGLTSMFVCPIIGLIGLIFGVKEKDKLFIALNVLLILLLPIAMFVGHLIWVLRLKIGFMEQTKWTSYKFVITPLILVNIVNIIIGIIFTGKFY